jgi:acyl-CoA reductase-like NAD-dependent aldehyde dehydrogenase
MLASENKPLCSITFAEVLATSDLPGGVANILTGKKSELISHFSNHMDVNAIVYFGNDNSEIKLIQELASLNVKRVFVHTKANSSDENAQGPYHILDLQEIKTTWHPIENIGVGGAKY